MAIDVAERYIEILNQMYISMHLFRQYLWVAELTSGVVADYIK